MHNLPLSWLVAVETKENREGNPSQMKTSAHVVKEDLAILLLPLEYSKKGRFFLPLQHLCRINEMRDCDERTFNEREVFVV